MAVSDPGDLCGQAVRRHGDGCGYHAGAGGLVSEPGDEPDEAAGLSWDGVRCPPAGVPCPGSGVPRDVTVDHVAGVCVRVAVT
jgi:hypothetical protein